MNVKNSDIQEESFRDHIATIDEQGKRVWLYPQQPEGKLYRLRNYVGLFLLAIFFILPFIKVHGEPVFLLNVIGRKFILFGSIFWPQDFFLFVIAMILFIVFIVFFTVIYGRIFCGWACPQTIFMELVFRRIEYWIEGNANKQRATDRASLSAGKMIRKLFKHIVFFLIAFLISNTFLAYLIGIDRLTLLINSSPLDHLSVFIPLILFSGVFYWVFAWFREQVCIVACPYGRLQGVLLYKNSIVIAYDYIRGEPRGKIHKNQARTIGDCIDCYQCVKVCPTGIDIRNGTQLECTNCTACIDACDNMMERVGLPKGLIRYDSEDGIANGKKLSFTTRMAGYSLVLAVLVGVFFYLLASRSDLEATLLRAPGIRYQELSENKISNLYNIKVVNKTRQPMLITLKPSDFKGKIRIVGKPLYVEGGSLGQSVCFIILDKADLYKPKTKLHVGLWYQNRLVEEVETNFMSNISR